MSIPLSDLVIGTGEIGKPIYTMVHEGYGEQQVKSRDIDGPLFEGRMFRFLHICYPQITNFPKTVLEYAQQYQAEHIIIHSTVSPWMLDRIDRELSLLDHKAYLWYSPVRGNIQDGMLEGLKSYTKYIAPALTQEGADLVVDHLRNAGFKVKFIESCEALVYAKIVDLAWYGMNIAFYQEVERICKDAAMPIEVIHEFIESTVKESGGKVKRQVMYGGFIGGHCVIPAIEKIVDSYPFPMLEAVLESNRRREQELCFDVPGHHPRMRMERPNNP